MATQRWVFSFVVLFAGILCAAAVYLPAVASAQASTQLNPFFGADLTLELSPLYPRPGETVRVTARSILVDLSSATLEWLENGKKVAGGVGVTFVDAKAGALGTETTVTAMVFEDGIEVRRESARIHPTELELLWESNSYVPPFFRGRALPSAGTTLSLEAIPRLKRGDGSSVPDTEITFTWRRNGYVVQEVSGRGASKVTLESPSLFGVDTITVEARTSDGLFESAASVRIPSVEPRLVLYEKHPLFGVMYHNAIPPRSFRPEIETSFTAVPYFAEALADNDGRLVYEWRVNGNPIANDPARPNSITINARGSSGLALIELALSHATNLFLNSFGSWTVTLDSGEGGGGFFTNTIQ
ncbi:hypothetical protein A3B35_01775 [Candidatus Kaiserbacteria bacterium RIFCSPLOWO2_01_FULL_54_24]|uniref:Uncharacterized protein n=1 Tax=Candidatus Kaiserbacteria bacterium RIFCSPLOWO2_01_FULL_54_24 TaxID=1798515 RepID=A0A1F6EVK2_9BACT|nr:MAG: hypothetical protein A3B35_01775 [Candidatus Kaiserbacteria bacterium RIFCSPLOWO2_01_FULL_54_24]